jgi:putative ABC transport system substrate-binding protein
VTQDPERLFATINCRIAKGSFALDPERTGRGRFLVVAGSLKCAKLRPQAWEAILRRREFITLLGGAAAWPLAAQAQQTAVPVIGWLRAGGPPNEDYFTWFRQGLNELGYVEGRNVAVELRNSAQYDRLPALASELVGRRVATIFADNLAAAVATRAATATIPIVFAIGGDPVRDGLVTSVSRPSGNLTGVTFFAGELLPKRLELLRELVPTADLIAVLLNPSNPNLQTRLRDVQEAARTVGQRIIILSADNEHDIDTAFATMVQQRATALLVSDDPFLGTRSDQIVALAARHRIPACFFNRDFVVGGGLMSYQDDRSESIRQIGRYVGRILKGEKPADLPVMQPAKFELKINLKTAKALGLTVPLALLGRADELIE